jgi:hypothetical protein
VLDRLEVQQYGQLFGPRYVLDVPSCDPGSGEEIVTAWKVDVGAEIVGWVFVRFLEARIFLYSGHPE